MRIAITGAATGIGAEVVKLLKAEGHHITAFDIAEPKHVDHWIEVDLSNMQAIESACDSVIGPFDVLINNAGLPPRGENQQKVLAVNVFGLTTLTHAMLPKLSDGASIVNTASKAGYLWQENIEEVKALLSLSGPDALDDFIRERDMNSTQAYVLSKEAVIAYTQSMTQSLLKRGIRMNSVSPAPVATDILDDFLIAMGERAATTLELTGRPAEAEEVAQAIVFMASGSSGWIKGHDLLVDGGITAMASTKELGLNV